LARTRSDPIRVGGLVQPAQARAASARGSRGRVLRSTPRRKAHRSHV